MRELRKLFTPAKIGTMEVKNRIVYAAAGILYEAPDSTLTDMDFDFYGALAKGGVGMITVGIVAVEPIGRSCPGVPGLWDDKFIPGWKQLADVVHGHGGKLIAQLHHAGRQTGSYLVGDIVAPSALPCPVCKETPRELTVEEIEELVERFGQAARRAREAGCDGIELHGTHGYLLAQFISHYSNKRSDEYGGSLENRLKFPIDIIKRIRRELGQDYPLIFRMVGEEMVFGGHTIHEATLVAPILAEAGVDALHVSRGCYEAMQWIVPPHGLPYALNVPLAEAVKKVVDVPVIAVGRIPDPVIADEILEAGKADFIAMARALIADPDWPKKAAAGRFEDIVPCIYCNVCLAKTLELQPAACVVNPTLGKTKDMALVPAEKPKKVLVAGGGLAGMEAARVSALRGHQVILYERADRLGGQFNLAAMPPAKQELAKLTKYLSTQVKKAGVKVELGKEVTPELVDRLKPDVVIVATGSTPFMPPIPGVNGPKVVTAHDVLAGKVALYYFDETLLRHVGNKVIIIGGGMVGAETADYARERGASTVTLVEMLPDIALDMPIWNKDFLVERLTSGKVDVITSAQVKEILEDGLVFVRDGKEETVRGTDNIVLATGVKSVNELSAAIKDKAAEVYVIGDAKEPSKALEAIAEGAAIGRQI